VTPRPRSFWERVGEKGVFARLNRFATRDIWHVDLATVGVVRGWLTRIVRVFFITIRGFHHDRCIERAAALTYTTIFALPAVLALAFSIAKGFGAYQRLKEGPINSFLDRAFPQGGGEGSERIRALVEQIFAYVREANLTALTTVGVLFVIYAALKLLTSVERAFNEIWGVQRARTWVRRFADYLSIVLVAPIALLIGTYFTAKLQQQTGPVDFSPVMAVVPFASLCLGMGLVLLTMPNTRVKVLPALVGGLVAGLLWQVAQTAFVEFQLGLARLNAIFAGFAAVPLLLSWIYASWITLFVGAELSFAAQNETVVTSVARTGIVDQRVREQIAPRLAGRITAAFLAGEEPPDAARLATELGVAPRVVAEVLEALVRHGLMAQTSDEFAEGYLPARDPDTITVLDLLEALRRDDKANPVPTRTRLDERVERILSGFEETLRKSLLNHTLRELARTEAEPLDDYATDEARPRAADRPAS